MNRDEFRAFIFGLISLFSSVVFFDHGRTDVAISTGLFSVYWFALAASRERRR